MVMDKYNPDAGREGPHRLRGGMGADLVDDTAGGGHDSQACGPWKNGVRAPVIGARMSKDSPEQAAKKAGVNNYIVKPFNAETLKGKIKAALFYPAIVIVIAVVVVAIIMWFVIPSFKQVFVADPARPAGIDLDRLGIDGHAEQHRPVGNGERGVLAGQELGRGRHRQPVARHLRGRCRERRHLQLLGLHRHQGG